MDSDELSEEERKINKHEHAKFLLYQVQQAELVKRSVSFDEKYMNIRLFFRCNRISRMELRKFE